MNLQALAFVSFTFVFLWSEVSVSWKACLATFVSTFFQFHSLAKRFEISKVTHLIGVNILLNKTCPEFQHWICIQTCFLLPKHLKIKFNWTSKPLETRRGRFLGPRLHANTESFTSSVQVEISLDIKPPKTRRVFFLRPRLRENQNFQNSSWSFWQSGCLCVYSLISFPTVTNCMWRTATVLLPFSSVLSKQIGRPWLRSTTFRPTSARIRQSWSQTGGPSGAQSLFRRKTVAALTYHHLILNPSPTNYCFFDVFSAVDPGP